MSWAYPEPHRVFVRQGDGPLGERRYGEVANTPNSYESRAIQAALEAVGHTIIVQRDARPPHSGR
jgi:hypothetical protein